MNTTLTVARAPHEVAALFDRLRLSPLDEVFAALGMPAVQLVHRDGRLIVAAGDGPDSAEVRYERAPMLTPYDVSRTCVTIATHDREGRALADLLTAALVV